MCTVYLITNQLDGKMYVGMTAININLRWSQHVSEATSRGRNRYLCKAIRKHGRDAFSIEPLETCLNVKELRSAECRWISKLGTLIPHGYNMTTGGEGLTGYKATDAQRKAMSIARTGRVHSEETKIKIGRAHKGKKLPPSQIELLRQLKTGTTQSQAVKTAISRPVMAEGITYGSLGAAALALGISPSSVSRRIDAGWAGYASFKQQLKRANRSPEQVEKMKDARANPVVAGGKRYRSLTEAAVALGVTRPAISYRIKANMAGYYAT